MFDPASYLDWEDHKLEKICQKNKEACRFLRWMANMRLHDTEPFCNLFSFASSGGERCGCSHLPLSTVEKPWWTPPWDPDPRFANHGGFFLLWNWSHTVFWSHWVWQTCLSWNEATKDSLVWNLLGSVVPGLGPWWHFLYLAFSQTMITTSNMYGVWPFPK